MLIPVDMCGTSRVLAATSHPCATQRFMAWRKAAPVRGMNGEVRHHCVTGATSHPERATSLGGAALQAEGSPKSYRY